MKQQENKAKVNLIVVTHSLNSNAVNQETKQSIISTPTRQIVNLIVCTKRLKLNHSSITF